MASIVVSGAAAAATASAAASPHPTFTADIAPIVYRSCIPCHRDGGNGPFSLALYQEVRRRARLIATVTRRRIMPPWKPATGFGEFLDARRLTDAEIDTFDAWLRDGTPEGDPALLPPMPPASHGWLHGEPDLVIDVPSYTLRADGPDVFRNFVVAVPGRQTRYVRNFEFRPRSRGVHHANIRIDRTPTSRRLDDEDPAPGYDGLLAHTAQYPDGQFLAWTPGQAAPLLPKGLAWRLEPGTDLVVELHLQPTGKHEILQPSIGLFFTDDPPERTPGMLRLGRQNIDIPAGERKYTIKDSFTLPVDVQLLALQPHAHYRARHVQGSATLPDGSIKSLIDIPDWDFRWQQVYRFVTPVKLPKAGITSRRSSPAKHLQRTTLPRCDIAAPG